MLFNGWVLLTVSKEKLPFLSLIQQKYQFDFYCLHNCPPHINLVKEEEVAAEVVLIPQSFSHHGKEVELEEVLPGPSQATMENLEGKSKLNMFF